jgi:predicted HTH transcriptional regulator
MTLEEILAGESKNLEFKVQRPKDSIKYMRSVVAFANGEGGRIIFGVDDKTQQVAGISEEVVFSEIDVITEAISDSCEPAIIPDVYLQTLDGKTIIIADISEGRQRPYYIRSLGREAGVYVRVAGTSRPADEYMIKELMLEGSSRSFDQIISTGWNVTDEEINALCAEMHEQALKNALHKEDVKTVGPQQLLSWGILAEKDGKYYPTNAFFILTGSSPIHTAMQCGVFKGTTKAVFVDRREYSGPLWKQIDNAVQFVLRNIHLGAEIVGIYRQDIYEIPPDSIRELIVNAAVHRSYLDHNNTQIAVYDDRLEITSPGKLPMGQTIERMKKGYSRIRNEAIANAFSYMHLIEHWGSGIPRIMQEVQEAGLKAPEFIGGEVDLRINIYRKQNEVNNPKRISTGIETGNTDQEINTEKERTSTENSYTSTETQRTGTENNTDKQCTDLIDGLSETEQKLLSLIKENPTITLSEMASRRGMSKSGVQYVMNRLRAKGVVVREGSQKKGKWVIRK